MVEVRQCIYDFSQRMELELQNNEHKTGWKLCSSYYLLTKLKDQVEKLQIALVNGEPNEIEHKTADLANFAMMIFDNCR